MCGILCLIEYLSSFDDTKRELFMKLFSEIKNRGPEAETLIEKDFDFFKILMGFQRLKINDTSDLGNQPFMTDYDGTITQYFTGSMTNGEIYNHLELEKNYRLKTYSKSDCECIFRLYKKEYKPSIKSIVEQLDGEFAGVIVDYNKMYDFKRFEVHAYRDPFGVRPLYYGKTKSGGYAFASELKGLVGMCYDIKQFPPGYILTLKITEDKIEEVWQQYYSRHYPIKIYDEESALIKIRETFETAVKKRMMSDRPMCCLLSGGLDSSLMASILAKYSKEKIHTFCVGMEGGEDFKYAREVADFIKSEHHEIVLTEKDFLDALPEVVRIIETFDGTTCRASTGQYLVSKYIKENTDFKVVYVGEGSDELTGGYLYFHNAPDEISFDKECKRLLQDIHYFDGKRSDRAVSHFGLETHVPYLDKDFVDSYLSISPELRYHPREKQIEKYLLRKAFDTGDYLPSNVLWRKKEAFSDGVSSEKKSWYQIIQEYVKKEIGEEFEEEKKKYAYYLMPYNEELYYYRKIFDKHYPDCELVLPYYWLPKWSGKITEASARVLKVYQKSE
jgi:asparagine synthase (glutamine-hydrolysing)